MPMDEDSLPLWLAEESIPTEQGSSVWTILVVDDEADVHAVTNMVLEKQMVLERRLEFLHAYSAEEAIQHLDNTPDIAVILLDIVMAHDTDGLDVARYVRTHYDNPHTRIIVRTGQPGMLHESEAASDYGVNYYEPKTQLTSERLRAVVHMALDSYRASRALDETNRKLREVIADVELFSHAIGHDIRGPARNLHMLSELLGDELRDAPSSTKELVEALQERSSRLLTMLEQLLSLSQMGKDSLNPTQLDIAELVNDAVSAFRTRLVDENLPVTVSGTGRAFADSQAIAMVINNLLDNAAKYRSPDRPLSIDITIREPDTHCEVIIKDNGLGIPTEKLEDVFLPFRRASRDEKTEGSGIGLALCKRIVDLHNGSIRATSDQPQGTSICLALPRS